MFTPNTSNVWEASTPIPLQCSHSMNITCWRNQGGVDGKDLEWYVICLLTGVNRKQGLFLSILLTLPCWAGALEYDGKRCERIGKKKERRVRSWWECGMEWTGISHGDLTLKSIAPWLTWHEGMRRDTGGLRDDGDGISTSSVGFILHTPWIVRYGVNWRVCTCKSSVGTQNRRISRLYENPN